VAGSPATDETCGGGWCCTKTIENWSRTSSWQRAVKTGGRLVEHACFHWLMLSKTLRRRMFTVVSGQRGATGTAKLWDQEGRMWVWCFWNTPKRRSFPDFGSSRRGSYGRMAEPNDDSKKKPAFRRIESRTACDTLAESGAKMEIPV
jgi:hypothetical protein